MSTLALQTSTLPSLSYRRQGLAPTPLLLVVLAHAGLLLAMTALGTATPPEPAKALMVELITPQAPKAPKLAAPVPTLPTRTAQATPPKASAKRTAAPPAPSVLATRSEAPTAPVPELRQPAKPSPVRSEPTATSVASATPVAQASPAAAPPAPAPTPTPIPARLDANYLDNPKPVYPPLSRKANEEGKVVLKVLVEPNGLPSRVEISHSSGFDRLDKSAVTAVTRWKFTPARLGSEAVAGWISVPIHFSLND